MINTNNIFNDVSNDDLINDCSAVKTIIQRNQQILSNGNVALKPDFESNQNKALAIANLVAGVLSNQSYEEVQKKLIDDAKIIDAEYVVEESKLSDEKSQELALTAANDNMFPTFPTDPKALVPYITVAKKAVEAESMLLKTLIMVPKKYNQVLATAQEHAGLLLKAELLLAEQLKGIKTCRGMRSDIINKKLRGKLEKEIKLKNKSKKDIIMNDYKLTIRQARDIEKLTPECVEAAIEEAQIQHIVPTRALALSMLPKNPKEQREKNNFTPVIESNDKILNLPKRIKYTSLFANVGIGTYYLENMGLDCAVANEFIPERAKWHEERYKSTGCTTVCGDFTDPEVFQQVVDLHKAKECDLLLASPVCKDFSKANISQNRMKSRRTALFEDTMKFIRATLPTYVMIENVPDFLVVKPKYVRNIIGDKAIGQYLKDELESLGYIVNIGVFNAADYGTAQDRKRGIILASRNGEMWKFPKKQEYRKMLFEVIGDLPSMDAGVTDLNNPLHRTRPIPVCQKRFIEVTPTGCSAWDNSKKYKPVNADGSPSGAKFKSSFSRLRWDKPCNTITTDNESAGGMINLHPGRPLTDGTYSDSRPLSLLELIRVTGLPDDFFIPSWASNDDRLIRQVIGECFAPLHVKALLSTLPVPANDNTAS